SKAPDPAYPSMSGSAVVLDETHADQGDLRVGGVRLRERVRTIEEELVEPVGVARDVYGVSVAVLDRARVGRAQVGRGRTGGDPFRRVRHTRCAQLDQAVGPGEPLCSVLLVAYEVVGNARARVGVEPAQLA